MLLLKKPLEQTIFFILLSVILGVGSNFFRSEPISLLAQELAISNDLDLNSEEPVLLAISIDQAKEFFDEGVLFLDARDDAYYEEGHIKGAMKNAFLMELIFNIEEKQTKTDPLVVYCGDPGCGDSEDLAYDLQNEGFTKIFVFKGGWLEWSKTNYPISEER